MGKGGDLVGEYLGNVRGLLRQQPQIFGSMIERQIQSRLLPKVAGARAELEPHLWHLIAFCLDGPEAVTPPLDDAAFERAQAAARAGRGIGGAAAAYPEAALAVLRVTATLREVGVYPKPLL